MTKIAHMKMGRFMSPDEPFVDQNPRNPQSWNLYSYVLNNPLTNTDDDGRSVNVCTDDGNGGQQCTLLSNDQYQAATQGNGSLNVPSLNSVGTNGSGSITDANGNSVGSATYVSDGGADYYGNQAGYNQLAGASRVVNAAGSVEMSVMAPWAGALAGCASGDSSGSCAANLALSILPEVSELRAGATLLRAARGTAAAEILEKAGGFAQATKDFEALPGAEKTLGSVKVKELSDGSKAVLRNFSGDGRPTLEIQSTSGTTKVRYN
jgi:hypothetical protein